MKQDFHTRKRVTSTILIMFVVSVFLPLFYISPVETLDGFTLDGDMVYVDDEYAFLSCSPHTITSSGWITFNFTSKQYTGDIDVAWGFDTSSVQPKRAELWSNYSHTLYEYVTQNVSSEITLYDLQNWSIITKEDFLEYEDRLGNEFNTYFYNVTATMYPGTPEETTDLFHVAFSSYSGTPGIGNDIDLTFIEYDGSYEPYQEWFFDWKPYSGFQSIDYEYAGMNKWWYLKNVPVVSGKNYTLRGWVEVPFFGIYAVSGKYAFGMKRSSDTIGEAISNGRFYFIDPWYDSNWMYRKSHELGYSAGAGTNYQMNITVHYGSGSDDKDDVYLDELCQTDFDDLRFTDDDGETLLDYWIRYKTDSDNAVIFVEVKDSLSSANQTIYLYYGNNGASSSSNGTDTFLAWDDFDAGYSPGDPPDTDRGWISPTEITVENNPTGRPGQGLEFDSQTSVGSEYVTMGFAVTPSVATNFLWHIDGTDLRNGYGGYNEGGTSIISLLYQSGLRQWYDGGSYQVFSPGWTYGGGQWYELEERFVKDVSYIGVKNGTDHVGGLRNSPSVGVNQAPFSTYGNNNYDFTFFIDQFFVRKYVIDEPQNGLWGSLEICDEYQEFIVNNNDSDVDSSADIGTHSSFEDQRDGVNSEYDTLTEEDMGGMGEITFVAMSENSNGEGNAITIQCPAGVEDDDFLFLILQSLESADRDGVPMNTFPAGWTDEHSYIRDAPSGQAIYIWWKIADSEPSSYTWTWSGSTASSVGQIIAFRGVNTTFPIHKEGAVAQAIDNHPTLTSVTPTENGAMIFIYVQCDGDQADEDGGGTPGDYTFIGTTEVTEDWGAGFSSAYMLQETAEATGTFDWTIDASEENSGQQYAFMPDNMPPLHQIDLELQWIFVNSTRLNEELAIATGSFSDSEDLMVYAWNVSTTDWHWVMNLTESSFSNVSITDYFHESTFTLRLLGGSDVVDADESTWEIDFSIIHAWELSPNDYWINVTLGISFASTGDPLSEFLRPLSQSVSLSVVETKQADFNRDLAQSINLALGETKEAEFLRALVQSITVSGSGTPLLELLRSSSLTVSVAPLNTKTTELTRTYTASISTSPVTSRLIALDREEALSVSLSSSNTPELVMGRSFTVSISSSVSQIKLIELLKTLELSSSVTSSMIRLINFERLGTLAISSSVTSDPVLDLLRTYDVAFTSTPLLAPTLSLTRSPTLSVGFSQDISKVLELERQGSLSVSVSPDFSRLLELDRDLAQALTFAFDTSTPRGLPRAFSMAFSVSPDMARLLALERELTYLSSLNFDISRVLELSREMGLSVNVGVDEDPILSLSRLFDLGFSVNADITSLLEAYRTLLLSLNVSPDSSRVLNLYRDPALALNIGANEIRLLGFDRLFDLGFSVNADITKLMEAYRGLLLTFNVDPSASRVLELARQGALSVNVLTGASRLLDLDRNYDLTFNISPDMARLLALERELTYMSSFAFDTSALLELARSSGLSINIGANEGRVLEFDRDSDLALSLGFDTSRVLELEKSASVSISSTLSMIRLLEMGRSLTLAINNVLNLIEFHTMNAYLSLGIGVSSDSSRSLELTRNPSLNLLITGLYSLNVPLAGVSQPGSMLATGLLVGVGFSFILFVRKPKRRENEPSTVLYFR